MLTTTNAGRSARIGALLLTLAMLAACSEPEPPQGPPPVRPVKVFTVGDVSGGNVREFPGSVSATLESDLAFEVSGRIIEFPVTESQQVSAGTLLARLDDSSYRDARDKARAQRDAARADVARYEEAIRANAVTQQDVDLARRNLDVAEADLSTAEKALADTRLTAPFDGVVAVKMVNDFANVSAMEPVVKLQDQSGLEMSVDVPEQLLANADPTWTLEEVTRRARPRVVMSAQPDREIPARITETATAADPITRTFRATVAFEPPGDMSIQPGMTGKVVVNVGEQGALGDVLTTIPSRATLADEAGNAFVWRIDGASMTVSKVPVELGELGDGTVKILSGLNAGDRIAASGVHNLRDGMQVSEFTN